VEDKHGVNLSVIHFSTPAQALSLSARRKFLFEGRRLCGALACFTPTRRAPAVRPASSPAALIYWISARGSWAAATGLAETFVADPFGSGILGSTEVSSGI